MTEEIAAPINFDKGFKARAKRMPKTPLISEKASSIGIEARREWRLTDLQFHLELFLSPLARLSGEIVPHPYVPGA